MSMQIMNSISHAATLPLGQGHKQRVVSNLGQTTYCNVISSTKLWQFHNNWDFLDREVTKQYTIYFLDQVFCLNSNTLLMSGKVGSYTADQSRPHSQPGDSFPIGNSFWFAIISSLPNEEIVFQSGQFIFKTKWNISSDFYTLYT